MLWVHMRYSQPISETFPPEAALGPVDHSMESIIVIYNDGQPFGGFHF